MSGWRDRILREFTPHVAAITVVTDSDSLLLEEGILECIQVRGFELLAYGDPVAFRYALASRARALREGAAHAELVVTLNAPEHDFAGLPFDVQQAACHLSFGLADIFPGLHHPVLKELDRGLFDVLFDAIAAHPPGPLGDNATREFVLRHVFRIAPELIKQPPDLLHMLLQRHYRQQQIPRALDERLLQLLRQNRAFDDWPLETLLADRDAFLAFLQERWPFFLDQEASRSLGSMGEGRTEYGLKVDGPLCLPLEQPGLRALVDSLFLEGQLHPVPHRHAAALSRSWVRVGVVIDPAADRLRRMEKLIERLRESLPTEGARHGEWLHFAGGWAELALLANDPEQATPPPIRAQLEELSATMEARFTAWVQRRYSSLISLPPVPPVMLHHLPRLFARQLEERPDLKIALLVVDGLSYDQWLVVRDALHPGKMALRLEEQAVFAWVPSLTSVSRQALFAGKPPFFFPNSVKVTDREPALWAQFWDEQGLTSNEVVYMKGLGDGSLEELSELISRPRARVAGLVVDKVDRIMHGMELGSAGMISQVRQWARRPYLMQLFDVLLDHGYRIYLTSDHGNLEATGCGSPAEGVVADVRGERVRIYPDGALRSNVAMRFPDALEWGPAGLPPDFLPLVAPPRRAFIKEGQRTVCHGGISIEELIVPLVRIDRRIA